MQVKFILFILPGRQFDKNGNIRNWWSAETLANYLNRTQCFIDQYNNYYVPSGSHVTFFLLLVLITNKRSLNFYNFKGERSDHSK